MKEDIKNLKQKYDETVVDYERKLINVFDSK